MVPIKLRIIREQNRLYILFFRLMSFFKPNGSRVFLFHEIVDNVSDVKSQFSISKTSFEGFLRHQLSIGNHPNTFEDLSNIILKKKNRQDNSFIVTFDDANESVYTKAYPFLKQYNIPFIVFVNIELIGKISFLTKEQVMKLSTDPLCTIGSHGCHHVMYRYLKTTDVKIELNKSKLFLEKLINKPVICFALPYGRIVECSINNIRILKASNYQFSFSAIAANLNHSLISSKHFLPRINVDEKLVNKIV